MARNIIHAKGLPTKLWAKAIHTTVYLLNHTINTQLGLVTPYEKYFKKKPTVDNYQVFVAHTFVFKNKQQQSCKLDTKSFKGYFTGYSNTSKAYRFWDPLRDKIIESSDFRLDKYHGKYIARTPPDLGIHNPFSVNFYSTDDNLSSIPATILIVQAAALPVQGQVSFPKPISPLQITPETSPS